VTVKVVQNLTALSYLKLIVKVEALFLDQIYLSIVETGEIIGRLGSNGKVDKC